MTAAEKALDRQAERRRRQAERRSRLKPEQHRKIRASVEASLDTDPIKFDGVSTPEMLTEVRDRAFAHWRFAAGKADSLRDDEFWVRKVDAQGNVLVEPHRWIQYEERCRLALSDLGVKLVGLDLDERYVALEEAKALAVVAYLAAVVGDLRLTAPQKAKLRTSMEAHAQLLEGGRVVEGTVE